MAEDPELASLAMQISAYAFDMVAKQHFFAVGPEAYYDVDLCTSGKATLRHVGTGSIHEIDLTTRDVRPSAMQLRDRDSSLKDICSPVDHT